MLMTMFGDNCFIIKCKLSTHKTIIHIHLCNHTCCVRPYCHGFIVAEDKKLILFNDIIWPTLLDTVDVAMFYCL